MRSTMEILKQSLQLCDNSLCSLPIWKPLITVLSLQTKRWDLYFLCFWCTHIHVLCMYVDTVYVYMCMSVVSACVSVCMCVQLKSCRNFVILCEKDYIIKVCTVWVHSYWNKFRESQEQAYNLSKIYFFSEV